MAPDVARFSMPIQNSQGRLRPQAPRADELPVGTAEQQQHTQAAITRDQQGRVADHASAAELGRRGGAASSGQTRLARRLALGDTFADPRFEPYSKAAKAFRRVQVARLARDVGAGQCGPAPASIVASAALQLAASRFAFEVLGDLSLGSRLADASRANLLSAHELTAKEAQGRTRAPLDLDFTKLVRRA